MSSFCAQVFSCCRCQHPMDLLILGNSCSLSARKNRDHGDWWRELCKNWKNMELPSGKLTVCELENGHRNSGFSHKKLWFSIVMLVYQRVVVVCLSDAAPSKSLPIFGKSRLFRNGREGNGKVCWKVFTTHCATYILYAYGGFHKWGGYP